MALQARRFHGKPLLQPNYDFRDVPWCSRDLSGSTLSVVTERQHLVDSIAELTLLCNEATRRSQAKNAVSSTDVPSAKKLTKPLSIEYIFDRIDTDDPIWGLMVRTDTPVSFKGRPSNLKASPLWKKGMLQGFITMTTFTNWQSSFRFDSLHDMAFGQDDDELEEQMKNGLRKYDEDGSLAEELEATVKGGNPHLEGIVYPRIAEVSLFGGLGCGKQLLRLLVEHLECLKASAEFNYDYVVLQATENSIPFYESMGFTRVGCVQGTAPSPDKIQTSPVEEYHTKKNGESPVTVAKEFGVDVWDLVFLNKPLWPDLQQKSWLKMGTKLYIPKPETSPKWYMAQNNETLRGIAKKFRVDFSKLLQANKRRIPDLTGNAKLMKGTNIQISRFHIDEGDTVAYSHWTFPDAELDDDDVSYMMAMKLNRKKGAEAKVKPVAFSLSVPMKPYSPAATGVKKLLIQPGSPRVALAPIFTKEKAVKEPKKPKRPMTSYAHFMSDARTAMAAELKGLSFGEINKVISDKWKVMWDDEKIPYEERSKKSKAEYDKAMKKYVADMERFQRESSQDSTNLAGGVDVSLLEKVVKLKASHGISGIKQFEYFYVLTFIPDLQWVHLIPMRKAGVFGPEHGRASGRPIWMIVGEDEGKEIDTTAAMCEAVTSFTVKNSADADDEQWDIYDNGEALPSLPPAPSSTSDAKVGRPPGAPPAKLKKPATSFAFFCGEASSTMKEQLEKKTISERTKLIAARWKTMTNEEKQKYKDRNLEAHEKYSKALKEYEEDLAKYCSDNPRVDPSSLSAASSKTPKSSKPSEAPLVKSEDVESQKTLSTYSSKIPKSATKIKALAVKTGGGDTQPLSKKPKSSTGKTKAPATKAGEGEFKTPKFSKKTKTPVKFKPIIRSSSSATSLKTPKSIKRIETPTTAVKFHPEIVAPSSSLITRKATKRYPDYVAPSSSDLSSATPKSAKKINTPKISGKKRGRPRKSSSPNTEAKPTLELEDETSAPKMKRGRLSKQSPGSLLHTVKNDPVELEKLLGKLTGDFQQAPDKPGEDIILSLKEDCYKEIMWRHFNILGKNRDSQRENEVCDEVFALLKQKMGNGGKFLKRLHGENFQVDEVAAREKIIADIRRRVTTAQTWLDGEESQDSPLGGKLLPPVLNTATNSLDRVNNGVVLSLTSEKYKDTMWNHFKELGRRGRGGARAQEVEAEEEMGRKIFQILKKGLGRGGVFFKKPSRGSELLEVDDDAALQKIIRDLKCRMISSHNWLDSGSVNTSSVEESPRLTPTRNATRGSRKPTKTTEPQTKPQSSPSRYPRRRLADEVQESEEGKASSLRRNSGEEDAHILERPSSTATTKPKRPLAPIFLRSRGEKKIPPTESEELKGAPRTSPRKRKQITYESHVVSDDAVSEATIDLEPGKKRARTKL